MIRAFQHTFIAVCGGAAVFAVLFAPFLTWTTYGFSFQFLAASAVFIFVLLVALLSW